MDIKLGFRAELGLWSVHSGEHGTVSLDFPGPRIVGLAVGSRELSLARGRWAGELRALSRSLLLGKGALRTCELRLVKGGCRGCVKTR